VEENLEKKEILLEAGTNELEVVEFSIADALYGINIAKVREIIKADIEIIAVPDAHTSIQGAINLRGRIIPVINLAKHLNENVKNDPKSNRIIISEFNMVIVGFFVSSVANIHRLSWKQVEKPSELLQTAQGYVVGVIKIGEKVLFLLDFEKITGNINPSSCILKTDDKSQYDVAEPGLDRSSKTILIAEDSEFIRDLMVDHLTLAGYKVVIATNGEEAMAKFMHTINSKNFEKIQDHYNLLITDIEMPQMDGLHLVKTIKDNEKLCRLPCIAFSSMISPELAAKCKSVGTSAEISKPEIEKLVNLVDTKVL